MAKYIDAERLKAEIAFCKSVYDRPLRVVHGIADAFRQEGRAAMCADFIEKIDALQQEQTFAIYEKSRNVHNSWMGGTMDDVRRDMAELGRALDASRVEKAMREVEEKAKAFTAKHKGESADEILARMRGEEWIDDYRAEDIQTRFAFYTYKDEPSVLYLSNVFVEEVSRNHGFGTRILKAAEKVAETFGASTIRLKVMQDSPSNAWYRKHGYCYVDFEDGYDWLEKELSGLPGIEASGIPGKDYIPVEWVDACERFGKWKIVRCEEGEL